MNGTDAINQIKQRIEAHPLVVANAIGVHSEAEHFDLESLLMAELNKGGLHVVVALGTLEPAGTATRNGAKFTREAVVSIVYVPGLSTPPVVPLELSEALAQWLHGMPLAPQPSFAWVTLAGEQPMPDGADVSGRQITLKFPEFVDAAQ